jgi:hypothetical protein
LIKSIGFPSGSASASASAGASANAGASASLALERPNIPPNYQAAIQDPVYFIE